MEYSGPAPLGSQATLLSLPVSKPAPALEAVCPSCRTNSTGADAHDRPEQDQKTAAARDIAALTRDAQPSDGPAGPPPSFQVSLLEMQSDLKYVLARIEAARAKSRDAEALRVEADAAEVQAQAEADGLKDHIAANSGGTGQRDANAASTDGAGAAIATAPPPIGAARSSAS